MKKVLLIATGGTIASVKTETGLSPKTPPDEFLKYIPEAREIADIDVIQVLNIDSTNIEPKHWIMIKDVIEQEYDNYDGFVVTHGTDTLAYTAAALSYLIQDIDKVIAITGAQKPIVDTITDGKKNLIDAIRFSLRDKTNGVYVVFDGKAILGTRAKKVRTKSYAAFDSINYPIAAFIDGNRILQYVDDSKKDFSKKFYNNLNKKVFLLKLTPGLEPEILEYIGKRYDGIIIESYGVGGLPFNDDNNFKEQLKKLTEKGKIVVIATQVILEGSDAATYEVGYDIIENYNVLQAYDMTVEAAVVKLMWILSITEEFEEAKTLFYKTINKDIIFQE